LTAVLPGSATAADTAGVIVEYHGGTSAAQRLDTRGVADVTRDARARLRALVQCD